MGSGVDTKAAYAIRVNDSSVHTQMTADFFRATLTASSNDVQEKSDHGKKEQVEKAQVEATRGQGQTRFGQTHVRQEERCEKESQAGEGEEKGRGKGKESRQKSGRQKSGSQEGGSQEGNSGCPEARRQEGPAEAETCADAGVHGCDVFHSGLGARDASGDEFRRGIIVDVNAGSLGAYQPL
jgi:hypothetical protein